jgi:hypothetical protein
MASLLALPGAGQPFTILPRQKETRMGSSKKRNRRPPEPTHSPDTDTDDDDCDCLWHLDEARRRELGQWNQGRWRLHAKHADLCGEAGDLVDCVGIRGSGARVGAGAAGGRGGLADRVGIRGSGARVGAGSAGGRVDGAEAGAYLGASDGGALVCADGAVNVSNVGEAGALVGASGGDGMGGEPFDLPDVGDATAAQVFLPLWQACLKRLKTNATVQDAAKVVCGDAVKVNAKDVVVEAAGDLLVNLDEERRKEMNRLKQRRRRARQQAEVVTNHDEHFDNELSMEERAACMKRLRRAIGPEGLDECVCAACDRLTLRQDAKRMDDTDSGYLNKMRDSLTVNTTTISRKLLDMYRSPSHIAILDGIMISPRGIHSYTDEHDTLRAWVSVCRECDHSIQCRMLPKFAIANGFFVGRLEQHLQDLTIPERFMTQLASIMAMTCVMRGGRHRCIRSHCIAFDCTPGPPASLLPRSMDDVSSYRVVLVGELTSAQATRVRKMHNIRNKRVRELMAYYKMNNHLYADITENEAALNYEYTDTAIEQAFVERIADRGGALDDNMDREQENVRGESDGWRLSSEDSECSVIERRMGLTDDGTPIRVSDHTVASNASAHDNRTFDVRRSNHISNDVSGNLLARMFPHLFPFGSPCSSLRTRRPQGHHP